MADYELAETITKDFPTHNPSTGASTDADSAPTWKVYEDATDTAILSGTATKRTGLTGLYRLTFAATTANGFEVGKSYNVVASATVSSIAANDVVLTFNLRSSGASSVATPGAGAGTMTLTDARDWLASAAADAKDTDLYSPADLDRAIYQAGEYFCRITRCLKRADSVALAASDSTFTLTGTPATNGFRPERLIDCYLAGFEEPLNVIDFSELNRAQAQDTSEGVPLTLAFLDWTTAEVYPTPDIAYTAKLRYWLPFISWDFGTDDPDSITLNLPTDYLPRVLSEGAASVLTGADKKNQFGSVMGQRFLQYVDSMRGAGNLGARVVFRDVLE